MEETKTAFVEGSIPSLKACIQLHWRLWIHLHSQVTAVCHNVDIWKELFDRLQNQNMSKTPSFCPCLPEELQEYRRRTLKLETNCASQSMIGHFENVTVINYAGNFWNRCICYHGTIYILKKFDQDEIIHGKFHRRELLKLIWQWYRPQKIGGHCICVTSLRTKHWVSSQTFCLSDWIWSGNGKLQNWNYTNYSSKMLQREKLCLLTQSIQFGRNFLIWNPVSSSLLRRLWKPWTRSFKRDTITGKLLLQAKCPEERKKLRFTWQIKDRVLKLPVRFWVTFFGSKVGDDFGVFSGRKGLHKPVFAYDMFRIHSFMLYTDLAEYDVVEDTKSPLLRGFSCVSKPKHCGNITSPHYMNYQTFKNPQFRPLFKNFFIVFTYTWEKQVVKSYPS